MSREYSTFDEYSDKIHEAGAVSFMTAPLAGRWDFARYLLDRTILQFGSGGGGAIVHGTTRSNVCLWFMQSAHCPERIVFDGRIIKCPGIVMIPPASHFTFACTGPIQWIITDILSEHGVTEFGRFAIEYKALFNESPTETLQKYLVPRSNGSHSSYRKANN